MRDPRPLLIYKDCLAFSLAVMALYIIKHPEEDFLYYVPVLVAVIIMQLGLIGLRLFFIIKEGLDA